MLQMENSMADRSTENYEHELLTFLKLFKRQQFLGFSYEKKGGKWSLFLHFPSGVIQISGKKNSQLKEVLHASLISERIPWQHGK